MSMEQQELLKTIIFGLHLMQKASQLLLKKRFNSILDRIEEMYTPIIAEFGATLSVARSWSDGTVNAYARQLGSTWEIAMFGGLAKDMKQSLAMLSHSLLVTN